jgi:dienelactone hydrolase
LIAALRCRKETDLNRSQQTSKRLTTRLLTAAVAIWAGIIAANAQMRAGPQDFEQGLLRRQLWLVPSQDKQVLMRTIVARPPGDGPFPLVLINHGTTQHRDQRESMRQPVYAAATAWFVRRGYAVAVPQRPGHGETGGPYFEANSIRGGCGGSDYRRSGLATADTIQAAIDFFTQQPFVKRTGIIVVGQSAGGWGALALSSRNPRNVAGIINFAGGRGGRVNSRPNYNCAPEKLVETARLFGGTARIPVLSIYTENDSFFAPALSREYNDAYRSAGGKVDYRLLPAFGADGHSLLGSRDGPPVWGSIVEEFLARLR